MTVFDWLLAVAATVVWMGAYAQLLGMPVAWLRVRRSTAWRARPVGVRRIDILAAFIVKPTILAILWGWALLVVASLGGLGLSWPALLIVALGGPLTFVPWAVLQLDTDHLPHLIEEARGRRERQ